MLAVAVDPGLFLTKSRTRKNDWQSNTLNMTDLPTEMQRVKTNTTEERKAFILWEVAGYEERKYALNL